MIIAVLNYSTGAVDVWKSGANIHAQDEEIQKLIEERGHKVKDCEYMFGAEVSVNIEICQS